MARPVQSLQRAPLLGTTDNRAEFESAFLRQVHRLLQIAYESLNHSAYRHAEEDDISGDLCKHLKYLTEVAPTEKWMRFYSVHDQDPSNDVKSVATGHRRTGKRRPKIDFRIVSKHRVPNTGYCVEAKRLYRSDSVSEYLGKGGIGTFVRGDYATDDAHAGMLGYVQSDSIAQWAQKLENKLASHKSRAITTTQAWIPISFSKGPRVCFQSDHRRDNGDPITLVHVLLDFVTTASTKQSC